MSGVPTLTDVVNQTPPEINNVTRWIRDATLSIDNMWLDWKYHWQQYAANAAAANTSILPAPAGTLTVRQWDINKFRYRPAGVVGAWQKMYYYERQTFDDCFDPYNAVPGTPYPFTVLPNNTVQLAAPTDQAYDFQSEYWQHPVPLAAKTDVPLMPQEYHRMIVCRASVMYANREDAPEVISGMEAELIDFLDKLQADQLEGFALRRSSTDRGRIAHSPGLSQFLL